MACFNGSAVHLPISSPATSWSDLPHCRCACVWFAIFPIALRLPAPAGTVHVARTRAFHSPNGREEVCAAPILFSSPDGERIKVRAKSSGCYQG